MSVRTRSMPCVVIAMHRPRCTAPRRTLSMLHAQHAAPCSTQGLAQACMPRQPYLRMIQCCDNYLQGHGNRIKFCISAIVATAACPSCGLKAARKQVPAAPGCPRGASSCHAAPYVRPIHTHCAHACSATIRPSDIKQPINLHLEHRECYSHAQPLLSSVGSAH